MTQQSKSKNLTTPKGSNATNTGQQPQSSQTPKGSNATNTGQRPQSSQTPKGSNVTNTGQQPQSPQTPKGSHITVLPNITRKDYERLLSRPSPDAAGREEKVSRIIRQVEEGGDEALREICLEIDGQAPPEFEISHRELIQAGMDVDQHLKTAVRQAMRNIRSFHEAQLPKPATMETMPGVKCSIRYAPIEKVGLYIPGGTAPLLSTVLMTVIPATLAGCREIVACTPPGASPELLFTLSLFDIRVFTVGGAQAIAAMAFGTESIPKVDKIFGPGNAWVTSAKMQLAGRGLAIDMPAGPSEVMVIADDTANPAYVAADLLSQAEHGSDSQVILLADSMDLIRQTITETDTQLANLSRRETASQALKHALAICVTDITQALDISNYYGPEHLILSVRDAPAVAEQVTNAGSVFLGNYSPESAGDYASGTNHTLPTGGASRAWSGITTAAFMKSITTQEISREGLMGLAPTVLQLARAEQLDAHANAVLQRIQTEK
ncbi:MAG: histidinol dehydrogenase [Bacteroidales bacterium]